MTSRYNIPLLVAVLTAFSLGYIISYMQCQYMTSSIFTQSVTSDLTQLNKRQDDVERRMSWKTNALNIQGQGNDDTLGQDTGDNIQGIKQRLEDLTAKTEMMFERVPVMDDGLHQDDTSVADRLYKEVRVLCWVMTNPNNLHTRAIHIKRTWGRRCNKLLFISSVQNDTLPAIGVNTTEGRDVLTAKTNRAFRYIYKHYLNDYDWFMRTDDDGYVIMENLRYFLSSRDTNQPVYFGHHFKTIVKGGYFSGGPGIILGREALRRFGEHSLNSSLCEQEKGADDVELGKCLYNVGVYAANTSDILGRSRFHCFNPGTHIMGGYPDWYYAYDANGAHHGIASMSDYAIGFHYISADKMYELEYFIYHLRPYGILFGNQQLNQPWTKGLIDVGPIL